MVAFRPRMMEVLVVVGAWTLSAVTPAQAIEKPITVPLEKNAAKGAGFEVAVVGATSNLSVTIEAPQNWCIVKEDTKIRHSGEAFWQPPINDPNNPLQQPTKQTFRALGIGRDDDHSVGFDGKLRPIPLGMLPVPAATFDAAVADVRIAGHEITAGDGRTVYIPASSDLGMIHVTVTLQAASACPDPAGKLTLSWQGNGAQGITRLVHGTTQINNGGSINVPKAGFFNEPIQIETNANFTSSATITATFEWASAVAVSGPTQAQSTDYVRVAPATYALDVLDAQAFHPNETPGLTDNPVTTPVSPTYRRDGVFADGTSVLVIRMPPGVNEALTFSVAHRADPAVFPQETQETEYVGSLSSGFPAVLPAPDQRQGARSVDVAAGTRLVYYRPPNSFRFGRHGAQYLTIEVRNAAGQFVAGQDVVLVRPTIFMIHGVTSNPGPLMGMGEALRARGVASVMSVHVRYLDWSPWNTSGYDVASTRVPVEIADEVGYWRDRGIAATRVDTVGHSMGAVITKWYASNMGVELHQRRNGFDWLNWNGLNYQYYRDDNFGVGDIRRLVSVGSPFRGSIIADAVSNLHGRVDFLEEFLNRVKKFLGGVPDDINAFDDLGTGSQGTQILSGQQAIVSWFPIVGFGSPDLTEAAMFDEYGRALYILLGVLGMQPHQIDPPPGQQNWLGPATSDFAVDRWSQVDRWPGGATAAIWREVDNVTHVSEMQNGLDFPETPDTVGGWVAHVLDLWFSIPTDPNNPDRQPGYTWFNSSF